MRNLCLILPWLEPIASGPEWWIRVVGAVTLRGGGGPVGEAMGSVCLRMR